MQYRPLPLKFKARARTHLSPEVCGYFHTFVFSQMEYVIITFGAILLLVGLIGCVIPAVPGPPISYAALLLLLFIEGMNEVLETRFLLITAGAVVLVTVIDYVLPIWGTKKMGGSKAGVRGSTIGLILGLIFPIFGPLTIIVGPFVGALVAEIIAGKSNNVALKSALGSFFGFAAGTLLKLAVSGWISFAFIGALTDYYK